MYSVLIVEDELLVSIGLRNMIDWQGLGMAVVADAVNGEIALRKYRELKPDLIITDIKMPVMDGLQLIEAIRREDDQTRIVVLSCVQEFELLHKAMRLNVSDYILKLTMTSEEMNAVLQKVRAELEAQGREEAAVPADMNLLLEQELKEYLYYYNVGNDKAFQTALNRARPDFSTCGMAVCLMRAYRAEMDDEENETSYIAILHNLLSEQMAREGNGVLAQLQGDLYLLLLDLGDSPSVQQKTSQLSVTLEHLLDTIHSYLDVEAVVGVSPLCAQVSELPVAYKRANEALREGYYVSDQSVVIYGYPANRQSYEYEVERFRSAVKERSWLDDAYRAAILEGIDALPALYGAPRQQVWSVLDRLLHWPATNYAHKGKRTLSLALETGYDSRQHQLCQGGGDIPALSGRSSGAGLRDDQPRGGGGGAVSSQALPRGYLAAAGGRQR